jgi:hypothetical protein
MAESTCTAFSGWNIHMSNQSNIDGIVDLRSKSKTISSFSIESVEHESVQKFLDRQTFDFFFGRKFLDRETFELFCRRKFLDRETFDMFFSNVSRSRNFWLFLVPKVSRSRNFWLFLFPKVSRSRNFWCLLFQHFFRSMNFRNTSCVHVCVYDHSMFTLKPLLCSHLSRMCTPLELIALIAFVVDHMILSVRCHDGWSVLMCVDVQYQAHSVYNRHTTFHQLVVVHAVVWPYSCMSVHTLRYLTAKSINVFSASLVCSIHSRMISCISCLQFNVA